MGFGDAVASAGPYANNLHLVPDRQPHQHLITQFLQARCSSSKHWSGVGLLMHVKVKNPRHTARSVMLNGYIAVWSTCVPPQMTLAIIVASVAATHRPQHRLTRRLTAAARTALTRHVTLPTNPVADVAKARVVACKPDGHESAHCETQRCQLCLVNSGYPNCIRGCGIE